MLLWGIEHFKLKHWETNITISSIWSFLALQSILLEVIMWMHTIAERHRFDLLVGKMPWRWKWQPTPGFLPEKSHGQRSWVGYSPWGSQRVGHDWAHLATLTYKLQSSTHNATYIQLQNTILEIHASCYMWNTPRVTLTFIAELFTTDKRWQWPVSINRWTGKQNAVYT